MCSRLAYANFERIDNTIGFFDMPCCFVQWGIFYIYFGFVFVDFARVHLFKPYGAFFLRYDKPGTAKAIPGLFLRKSVNVIKD